MGLDIYFEKRPKGNPNYGKELAYFRKVNFLVRFFCNRDLDLEGQTPLVLSREDITDLKEACEEILSHVDRKYKDDENISFNLRKVAEENLPNMEGFFFGSTDYNGYYLKKVENVSLTCNELLEAYDSLGKDEEMVFVISY